MRFLLQKAFADPCAAWRDVRLLLADDAGMAECNRRSMHHEGPTDVITLRYAPVPGTGGAAAELVVNLQRASEEGRLRRRTSGRKTLWDAQHELALYLAHGCDHLAGAEDDTVPNRRRMRRRELKWLGSARLAGLFKIPLLPRPSSTPSTRRPRHGRV
jgi:ssRNA-specific RNase YbeY (16S rRNA maturation enzyme)